MSSAAFITKLRQARALVAKGWTRGEWRSGERGRYCYCAWGALSQVGLHPEDYQVIAPDGSNLGGIVTWNDAEGRTKAEVVAMFDNSIAALERPAQGGVSTGADPGTKPITSPTTRTD